MKRKDARENAFLMIFEKSFREEPMQELVDTAVECRALELNEYAKRLLLSVDENSSEIDVKIEKYLSKWKLSRLSHVAVSVLRLASCELLYFPDIPVKVTINEAVELAKKYATEDDASYINGVLGSFVKQESIQKDSEEPVSE